MDGNNELKNNNIKNCTCYCFDDTTKTDDFDRDNISIDEKSYENILVYNILYNSLIDFKPLRIRFDNITGFIRNYG